jgi:F0F1-type ATP synthase assembly protein I
MLSSEKLRFFVEIKLGSSAVIGVTWFVSFGYRCLKLLICHKCFIVFFFFFEENRFANFTQ